MTAASPVQLRHFGLVVGGVFVLIGGWSYWRGHSVFPLVMAGVGGPLVVVGALAPKLLAPVERGWMVVAHVLGRINTTVILALLYFLMFVPIGFIRRRFSDPLDRAMGQKKDTHWVRRTRSIDIAASYRHQF